MPIRDIPSKPCRNCGNTTWYVNLLLSGKQKGSYHHKCVTCARENMKKWKANNPEAYAKWRNTHSEKIREYRKKASESGEAFAQYLKNKHGISIKDYNRLLRKQKGVCAVCEKPCATGRRLAIDHDHVTGVIRGLLCSACNLYVGHLESPKMKKALAYLKRPRRPTLLSKLTTEPRLKRRWKRKPTT